MAPPTAPHDRAYYGIHMAQRMASYGSFQDAAHGTVNSTVYGILDGIKLHLGIHAVYD